MWRALLAVALAVFVAVAACGDAEVGGQGGGGPPPPELVAELQLLPLYPGAEPTDPRYPEGVSTGIELQTGYWASGTIEDVTGFYDERLPEQWVAAQDWERSTSEKGDVRTEQSLRSFTKDDLQLTIAVATTEKDPSRGNLTIGVLIEPFDSTLVPGKDGALALSLGRDEERWVLRWEDKEGEAGYRLSGTIKYGPQCVLAGQVDFEEKRFDEELPANAAEFFVPSPADQRLELVVESTITVVAVDEGGAEIVSDGIAFSADPFCE